MMGCRSDAARQITKIKDPPRVTWSPWPAMVNDAPLAQADVGIAMSTGTDVAIESAGITLLNGDISKLLKAIRLSRLTMRGIKQNLSGPSSTTSSVFRREWHFLPYSVGPQSGFCRTSHGFSMYPSFNSPVSNLKL